VSSTDPSGGPGGVRAAPGDTVTFSAGQYKPGETAVATLHSTPVQLGSFKADSSGVVKGTVTIPGATAPGLHELMLSGNASGTVGSVVVSIAPGVPANDNFATAQTISGAPDTTGTVAGTTVGATKQSGEPTPAGKTGGHSIWYSITPSASGQLRVQTCGSSFDTIVGVYTGAAVNALTKKVDDDNACGNASAVQLAVIGGTKYSIEVDGVNGASGSVALNWWLAKNDRIVSVSWTTAQAARLAAMAPSLGVADASQVQKTCTYVISYILGFVSSTPTPVTLDAPGHDVLYTDLWTPAEFSVIDRVAHKYSLDDADAVRFATQLVDYLLALGGH
jgi:hypothetical protein